MKDQKLLFTERIKEIRIEANLTQQAFEELFAVSQDTISLWENGRSYPNTEQLYQICTRFKVSADYLLGLSNY